MAAIVNLQRVKKLRARRAAERDAQENRVRHGRTQTQKANDARAEQRRRDALDGKQPEQS